MPYELIICEKPSAANKMAEALAEGKPLKKSSKEKVPYYEITRGKRDIVIVPAVGHLYGLEEKEKKGWTFPVFDIEWKPVSEIRKKSDFSKKYLNTIKRLAKGADEFTVACDYDQEGSVIGNNIIKFACKQKDANRMKFSTLTKPDLIEAYENKNSHLDWSQIKAGDTRHHLDFFNGVNYSRALTSSIKKAGSFKLMSTGRVQGPTLKIIVDREKEIKAFKPVPFWQIELDGNVNAGNIIAWHKKDKFWDKKEADKVMGKVKGEKKATVDKVEKKQFKQAPPTPFDLTTLQTEVYRCLRIAPKETLAIAQELYTSGCISYPRTSSQKLDPKIGFKKILSGLAKQKNYSELTNKLLSKKNLAPNNGKKTDPAHPAIYPTGIGPKTFKDREKKVYDLIVKRFMATFAEHALRQTMTIDIDCKEEIFIAKGTTTIEKGWHIFYMPYVKIEEEELPEVNKNDTVSVKKIKLHEKETQPPKRYTPASIIRELEKRNLGTKCLTSNNFVKINSNNQIHNENIVELFDSLHSDFPVQEGSVKIAINNKKTCFCFDEFDETESYFKLVSKRKLNKNEKVYRVEYKDSSFIEVTDEHPLLISQENSFRYIAVKNLKKGMKSVTSVKLPEKYKDIICSWEDFLEKSNSKTKLYGISNEIYTKRKKQSISQHTFGKKYNIGQSSICLYEKTQNIPFYIIKKLNLSKPKIICSVNKNKAIKNPFPLRMSSPLARILANLVGDCSIDSKKIIRENCYDFRYHNTNMDLINIFIKDIKAVFDVDLTIRLAKPTVGHLQKYYVRMPAIVGRIISILFPEVIKKDAVQIDSEFYPEFVGSLFDDEGHSMKSEQKLFISNTNFDLLENVRKMLSILGIKALLDKKQFKLYIRGKENLQGFLEKIPIASVNKKQRLIDNLSKKYVWRNYPVIKKERDILALLSFSKNNELTLKEIAKKIGLDIPNVKETIKLLRKKGFIKKIIVGISEYPRKKITYRLIKPIDNTFYKYIDEKVISSDFITKTISSIKQIDYDGYVYDITNNPEVPNFILSNGVVVHNSTRAQIIDTLFQRGYVDGKSIEATELGIRTLETLEKYTPKIVEEELTKHFEDEMEKIREGKSKEDEVLEHAKEAITKIIDDFKKHEKEIGKELLDANIETRDAMSNLGKCPKCSKGEMHIRKGKFGSFAACNRYPDCKTTFSIPSNALIKPCDKICEKCNFPKVLVIKKRKRPIEYCLNPKCPGKNLEGDAGKEAKEIAKGIVEKECPKCKNRLVLRGSIYGRFLGCSNFPKCRYTERIEDGPLKEDFKKKK